MELSPLVATGRRTMWSEITHRLAGWQSFDTWIVVVAAVAACSCSIPGLWLILRRQSMLGDAVSHGALPGVVGAFLAASALSSSGWAPTAESLLPPFLLIGAAVAALLTAGISDWLQRTGGVDPDSALGVVFITLFAGGLLLVRLFASRTDLDVGCVLLGQLDLAPLDRVRFFEVWVPRGLLVNGAALLANAAFVALCFKELRLAAFDPAMAATQGINSRWLQALHLTLTAATITAAFRTVGSILVIALLIVPGATALLICKRLSRVMVWTFVLALVSAIIGRGLARTAPAIMFARLGFPTVRDASSAGMIAVTAGVLFLGAATARWLWEVRRRLTLEVRIVAEDELGIMYRRETEGVASTVPSVVAWRQLVRDSLRGLARRSLVRQCLAEVTTSGTYQLTPAGRERGAAVVRSHRLFEAYMQKHFDIPPDHLHETAHRVEHFIDQETQQQMAAELESPTADPHGREIPEASDPAQ